MFKSMCGLLLLLGFTASLKISPSNIQKTSNVEGPEVSYRDDLLDLMMATGARDHAASHPSEDPAHIKEIENQLAKALYDFTHKMENIKLRDTATGKFGLVWIHGAGFYSWKPIMDKYLKINQAKASVSMVFPKSPTAKVTAWGGTSGLSWFDMKFLPIDAKNDPPHYGCSLAEAKQNMPAITQAIEALELDGVPAENIVIAGMSQGGYMALRAAMTYPKKLGGAFVYAGMLMDSDELIQSASSNAKDMPIEWLHGTQDDVLFSSMQDAGVQQLQSAGFQVRKSTCDAHHTSHPALYENLSAFMHKVMKPKTE